MCHPLRPRFRDRGRFSTQAADRGGGRDSPSTEPLPAPVTHWPPGATLLVGDAG